MAEHSSLSGTELHEPKGVDSASEDQVYAANGAGSGTWQKIDQGMIDSDSIKAINKLYLHATIDDISTAQSDWVVCPLAGTISKVWSVIEGAIATGDSTLTFEIGGTVVTSGDITVATSGSAAGTVDSSTPTGNNTLTAGQAIECITDGASTNTIKCHLTIEITLT